ncbi:MAG: hypothetical protein HY321_21705, partial [Armatimonadetes bacterium]|nr:hypothetical protein [Armatimonadota bacterium]
MRRRISTLAMVVGMLLVAGAASARETQLAGIRLGRPQQTVLDAMGNPTRIYSGMLPGPGAGMGAPGMGLAGGALPGGMPGMMPGMDGTGMPRGMPGMMPGMDGTGMPGG